MPAIRRATSIASTSGSSRRLQPEAGRIRLTQADRNLDQAELDLRYCGVVAEIDGVVTRRKVNPGNNVVAGQSLMAVRSLTDIWVDANFKETQLGALRIGQPADIEVDMYGSREPSRARLGPHNGNRIDVRAPAGRERDRQFRESRAACARPDRIRGLRSRQGSPAGRPVRDPAGVGCTSRQRARMRAGAAAVPRRRDRRTAASQP